MGRPCFAQRLLMPTIGDPNQQVIGVAPDRSPASISDLVDHLGRLRSPLGQVPADEHFVNRPCFLEVGDHSVQRDSIAMRIGNEGDSPWQALCEAPPDTPTYLKS